MRKKRESVEKEYSALAREIEFHLTPYLYQLGIPPHVTGYSYLRSAVVEFLLHPSEMRAITKTIYPRIALEHGTTVCAVERAIRHAIAMAWNNGGLRGIKGDPCTALLTFRRKPTNKGLHHRVCGYDPARIRRGNRSLSAKKEEITSIFASKRQLSAQKAAAEKQLQN